MRTRTSGKLASLSQRAPAPCSLSNSPALLSSGFDFFNIKIPHMSMKIGSASCESPGSLFAAESAHPALVSKKDMLNDWATAHGSGKRSYIAGAAFMDMAEDVDFIFGYDFVERLCGKNSMRPGTAYLWIQFPISVDVHKNFEMEKGVKYLLLTHTGWSEDSACIYTAREVGGNSEKVDVGPVSDPSRVKGFEMAVDRPTTAVEDEKEKDNEKKREEKKEEKIEEKKEEKRTRVTGVDTNVTFTGPANPEPEEGSTCFPASATVTLASGEAVAMSELATGDIVAVGGGGTSDIFMFTHKLSGTRARFLTLRTASAHAVTLTHGHFIYINGALAPASSAVIGDALSLASGAASRIVAISESVEEGLYNPQTLCGDIVVDGVRVSTYTTAVAPALAHAVLAPFRLLARWGFAFTGLESGGGRLAAVAPRGAVVF